MGSSTNNRGLRGLCQGWYWLLLLAVGATSVSQVFAANLLVQASYRGDPSGRFEIPTDTSSLVCTQFPSHCRLVDSVVSLPIEFLKTAPRGSTDPRQGFYVQVPSRTTVNVTHERLGLQFALNFQVEKFVIRLRRVAGIGFPEITVLPIAGCDRRGTFVGGGWQAIYLHELHNPVAPQACHRLHVERDDDTDPMERRYSDLGMILKMTMPSPLRMPQGIYRGSVTYSVGPGGDFDFGDGISELSTHQVTLDFELDVQHAFVVTFPPGADRAVLEPPGGWQAWLGGRAAPPKLHRDLPMRLWSTGPFKVYKQCQYPVGDKCGIRNARNAEVPVQVALSLPRGAEHQGQAVRRLAIPSGAAGAVHFEQSTPLENQGGQLHFDVDKPGVQALMGYPGSEFRGEVTVIFDSEI